MEMTKQLARKVVRILKTDHQIASFINTLEFTEIPERILGFLFEGKELDEFSVILGRFNWDWRFCAAALHILKEESGRDAIISEILKETRWDSYLMGIALTKIKEESSIMSTLEKAEWKKSACEIGIKYLKEDDNILTVMEKSEWDPSTCLAGTTALN